MRKLAMALHLLLALAGLVILGYVWGHMLLRGSGGFFSPYRNVVVGGGRVIQYLLALYSLVGVPAAFFSACRAWQLWGGADTGIFASWRSLTALSRVFAVLAILLIGVVIAAENPMSAIRAALGMQAPAKKGPAPTEDVLKYPELPLAAPDPYAWSVYDLEGHEVPMSRFAGKVVFLNAWATWCGYCVAEFPNIERLAEKMKDHDGFVMLLVSPENPSLVRKWVAQKDYNLPFYTLQPEDTPDGEKPAQFPKDFAVSGWPSTFILAPDGRMAFAHSGMAAWDGEKTINFLEGLANTAGQ